jgi:hypothetical protein
VNAGTQASPVTDQEECRIDDIDPFDDLARDPQLESAAGAAREERRAEEEEYARAAARQWARHRDLLDVARELQHRGDTVAFDVGETSFRGVVAAVGRDYVQVATPAGRVDVPVYTASGALPLVVRVVERARRGGRRAEPGAQTFRARLLEYDTEEVDALIGSALLRDELRGRLTVGRDHVVIRGADGREAYLPLAWIAWVRACPD